MSTDNRYKIQISSTFADIWRYNIAVTCGLFDAAGARTGFVAADDTVAPVGSGITARPDGVPAKRLLEFGADDCDRLQMYIYIIPHSMPQTSRIADAKPFNLSVKVLRNGKTILDHKREINQWGGASFELNVGHEGEIDLYTRHPIYK